MEKLKNYIGGELVDPHANQWLDNIEPATGRVYSLIPDSDERDVEMAVEAAREAFPAWSDMPIEKRSAILLRIADLIDAKMDQLATAESIDNGKPVSLAREIDIPRASANFRFFAQAITQFHSETYDMGSRGFNYTFVARLVLPDAFRRGTCRCTFSLGKSRLPLPQATLWSQNHRKLRR